MMSLLQPDETSGTSDDWVENNLDAILWFFPIELEYNIKIAVPSVNIDEFMDEIHGNESSESKKKTNI